MSANLDPVRSIYADWERGDYTDTGWAHPEIEMVSIGGPDPASASGVSGMMNAWRAFLDNWGDLRSSAEEYREIDDQRVLVLSVGSGVGRASSLPFRNPGADVFDIRGGEVRRLTRYWERDRAFADLGLTPGGES